MAALAQTPAFTTAAEPDPVIDKTRQVASAFTESLPKYLVKRTTTRYQSVNGSASPSPKGSAAAWHTIDIVTADVATENGKEAYTNIRLNGKPATNVDQTGTWSEGEFSSTLWAILSPESDAVFTHQTAVTLGSRSAWRYNFSIDQAHSSWRLYVTETGYAPAYGGTIWIDRDTSRVLRVEMSAGDMPESFPLTKVYSTVEYAFEKVGGEDYLLPSHSEAIYCQREGASCSRNATDFRDYRKYGADTTIRFEDSPK